jgi:hypothetical protein
MYKVFENFLINLKWNQGKNLYVHPLTVVAAMTSKKAEEPDMR